MLVYAIRHGQSENNAKGQWTGWFDAPLTEKGKNDAKKAGEYIQNIKFDKVYSSDLIRALQTSENALPSETAEKNALLREIHLGNIEGKPIRCLTEEQNDWARKHGYAKYGGETIEEFHERIRSFMETLETLDCENVAVFSHAGWIRGMLGEILGKRLSKKQLRCGNCTIAIFEYSDRNWQLHSWINL